MSDPQRPTDDATLAPGPGAKGPIDFGALTRLRDSVGDDAFLTELIGDFLGESPPLLAELRDAVVRGDVDRMRRTAHALRPSCMTMGAATLATFCFEIEQLAAGDPRAASLLGCAEAEFGRVVPALEAFRR